MIDGSGGSRRVRGGASGLGDAGVANDWMVTVIKAVGDCGEFYARNLGKSSGLDVARGMNALWRDGSAPVAPGWQLTTAAAGEGPSALACSPWSAGRAPSGARSGSRCRGPACVAQALFVLVLVILAVILWQIAPSCRRPARPEMPEVHRRPEHPGADRHARSAAKTAR